MPATPVKVTLFATIAFLTSGFAPLVHAPKPCTCRDCIECDDIDYLLPNEPHYDGMGHFGFEATCMACGEPLDEWGYSQCRCILRSENVVYIW